jgi:phosphomevalonate kinase
MRAIQVSAPGKLVLLGEYAVLFGHPAAVAAVDRRTVVEFAPARGDWWSVVAPGLVPEPVGFRPEADGGLSWFDPTGKAATDLSLVETVLGSLTAAELVEPAQLPAFDATIDSRAFYQGSTNRRRKLGLGSSAAVTVALASAMMTWGGRGELLDDRFRWLQQLLRLHREFQGGRGSGIDLAASLYGGSLEYRLDHDGSVASASPITMQEGLHLAFVWTQKSADTGTFLARLEQARESKRGAVDRQLARLGDMAASGIDALRRAEIAVFLELVDGYCDEMQQLGACTGLRILSDDHLRLRDLSRNHGVHYKPSGAGGGDMGMAFAADKRSLESAAVAFRAAGYVMLDARVDPLGLVIEV